ncbi:carboxypeptidase B-like [Physella acuta]|uniref:carboxypeptidase B-like n=1 Tax=Physella acuta TaxID=109671 RepID=UPI0027DDD662|nr:carboxypeptidase B-like [Physella acuta]
MASLTFSLCLLLATALAVCAEQDRFDGFQLLFVYSRNVDDVHFLHQIGEDYVDIDFWIEPTHEHNATVMVPPTLLNLFKNKLDQQGISYVIAVNDVQKVVEAGSVRTSEEEVARKRELTGAKIDHYNYHTYNQIVNYLNELKNTYPSLIQLSNLNYITHEGRVVYLVKMTGSAGANKQAIIVETGIHAREWVTIATGLWVIEKLAMDYTANDATARLMLDKYDWYFIPVANPDGYEHTFNSNRMWRKNKRYISSRCTGVDLNRNFDAMWGTTGISTNCASDIYPGTGPFSEPETANIRDLFDSLYPNIVAYLGVHAYSQFLLVPWGYTEYVSRPANAAELDRVTLKMLQALIARHGTQYLHGTAWQLLNYAASGSSKDWALRRRTNLYAMAFELRPAANSATGFLLPASQIVPTSEEFYDCIRAMVPELRDI